MDFQCSKCKATNDIMECELDLTEEALVTCPVCGTQMVLSATLKEPVMQQDAGGVAGMMPPPTAPPVPQGAPGAGAEEPAMAASVTDSDISKVLMEIESGEINPAIACMRLLGQTEGHGRKIEVDNDVEVVATATDGRKLVMSERMLGVVGTNDLVIAAARDFDDVNEYADLEYVSGSDASNVISREMCPIGLVESAFSTLGFSDVSIYLDKLREKAAKQAPEKDYDTMAESLVVLSGKELTEAEEGKTKGPDFGKFNSEDDKEDTDEPEDKKDTENPFSSKDSDKESSSEPKFDDKPDFMSGGGGNGDSGVPVKEEKIWKGTLAEFNTKLQAMFDDLGADSDLGQVTEALVDGGALTVKGDTLQLNIPKTKTALIKFLSEKEDIGIAESVNDGMGPAGIRVSGVPATPVAKVGGIDGPEDEMGMAGAIDGGGMDEPVGDEVMPEPLGDTPEIEAPLGGSGIDTEPVSVPGTDWEQKVSDALPKYF